MKIQKVKTWVENSGKQFCFLNSVEGSLGEIIIVKRFKDNKILTSRDPLKDWIHIEITSKEVPNLKSECSIIITGWIDKFYEDCIHFKINFEAQMYAGNFYELLSRKTITAEINDYEKTIDKYKEAIVKALKEKIDWANNWTNEAIEETAEEESESAESI